jgi:hypothetical protein
MMAVDLSRRRTTRTRRTLSVLSVVVLSVALTLMDAVDGRLAWSILGNCGSIVALAVHWRLTRLRSSATPRRVDARLRAVPTRTLEQIAG